MSALRVPAADKAPSAPQSAAARMEKLSKWRQQLLELKIRNDAELRRNEREAAEVLAEVREAFGVETIDELRELYTASEAENAAKIDAFEEALRATQERIDAIDAEA